jgi:transposase-like protein
VGQALRIVLDGLRGESSKAELCRREGINPNLHYRWSKDFLDAGKKRLSGDTVREANTDEVTGLKRENGDLNRPSSKKETQKSDDSLDRRPGYLHNIERCQYKQKMIKPCNDMLCAEDSVCRHNVKRARTRHQCECGVDRQNSLKSFCPIEAFDSHQCVQARSCKVSELNFLAIETTGYPH